jgi:predicted dehydrogenase
MIKIGQVGAGAWGKNLLRHFSGSDLSELIVCCDGDPAARQRVHEAYPDMEMTDDFTRLLQDDIDAVVVATPPAAHYELCRAALEAGKDVFVEKPLVLRSADGENLRKLARDKERILMVGHIMVYHPAVLWLRRAIADRQLGEIYYLYATRVNLGKVRDIENAMWSFAPHDISIMRLLLNEDPIRVSATGMAYLQPGIEDVVFMTLHYSGRVMAQIHVSWLDPHKIRQLTVVGQKKMAVFSDTEATEKVVLFDKGVDAKLDYDTYAEYLALRTGDISIPQINTAEPLKEEVEHFLTCVKDRVPPRSGALDGLRTLRVLEAGQESLGKGGAPVEVQPTTEDEA